MYLLNSGFSTRRPKITVIGYDSHSPRRKPNSSPWEPLEGYINLRNYGTSRLILLSAVNRMKISCAICKLTGPLKLFDFRIILDMANNSHFIIKNKFSKSSKRHPLFQNYSITSIPSYPLTAFSSI